MMTIAMLILISLICQVSCKIIYNVNSDNRIKKIGRYDNKNRAEWSYTGIHIQVASSSSSSSLLPIHININANNTNDYNYYINVLINCEIYHEYNINNDNSTISININEPTNSIHNIAIVKVTESKYVDSYGYVNFDTIDIIGGDLIDSNQIYPSYCSTTTTFTSNDNIDDSITYKNKTILFIGDSITSAYGVTGIPPCNYTGKTQNVLYSYASIVAKELQASDYKVVAWSGKGVVRNYGDVNQLSDDPMPVYYNRTIATITNDDENYWYPEGRDFVYIMLGTNDYSTDPIPSDNQFTNGLVDFIERIKLDYPKSVILIGCAPIRRLNQCSNIQRAAIMTSINYINIDESVFANNIHNGEGCQKHPSVETQKKIAQKIIPLVKELLK